MRAKRALDALTALVALVLVALVTFFVDLAGWFHAGLLLVP